MVAVIDETATNGAILWAKQIGGTGDQTCTAAVFDSDGNLVITGQYGVGPLDFGAGPVAPAATGTNQNVFVAKFDGTTGAFLQAAGFGPGTGASRSSPVAIAAGARGEVAVVGSVVGQITFGGTIVRSASTALADAFAVKLNADLTVATGWPVRIGGGAADAANAVAIDGQDQVWVAGTFGGTTTAPGTDGRGAVAMTSNGGTDAYLVRFSAAGVATFSSHYGDTSGQGASTLVAAPDAIWMGGTFGSSIQFPPLPALTSTSGTDVRNFLVKYQ